ncbi:MULTISPECIES: serine/threonine protein kinase [unclassified Streptomyces]|uniref:serine/threonine protein kinase n=1 Tax=unclassified Streptomyces TaxID=2593676 RepID=UPI0036E8C390
MDDYAGRVLADRYRLPLPPSDAYELVETRAFDTYSGQEVLVRQVPLPEVVDAEVVDGEGPAPAARRVTGRAVRRSTDPAVRRAIEAAQAAAQVPDHPRLDQVFDVFAEAGSLWIVSELVLARPLAALLAERPLNPFRAAEIGSDVLTALRVLHAHGWTHRNITVRTVLVCDDGRVVLTGLAAGAAEEALCGYVPTPQPDDDYDGDYGDGDYGDGHDNGHDNGHDGGYDDGYGARPGYGTGPAEPYASSATPLPPPPPAPPAEVPPSRGPAAIETGRPTGDPHGDDPHGDGAHHSDGYADAPRGGAPGELEAVRRPVNPALPAPTRPEGSAAQSRAERAGAIAAYREGARAAARIGEDRRRAGAADDEVSGSLPVPHPARPSDPDSDHDHPQPAAPRIRPAETPHDAAPYDDAAYPAAPAPEDPYAKSPYTKDPYAKDPYGAAPSLEAPYDEASYEEAPYGDTSYDEAPYGDTSHGEALYGDAPYDDVDDDGDDDGSGDDGPPPAPRRLHLTGTWSDGPGAGRPVPAGGSGEDALRADARRHGSSPALPAHLPEPQHTPQHAPSRWDEIVASGRTDAVYRGPATPLAAERARQTRIAVVGAVTERWAPEQGGPVHENWQLAPPIGPATDLWALGALLYRAVQGHAPYPEENAAELVQMVCGEPPAFAEECGPLRPVVESLLRQDPTERPDFEELQGWLRSLVRSAPEPEAGLDVVPLPSPDSTRLPVVRRRGELVRRRRGQGRHRHTKERTDRHDRPRAERAPKAPREPKGPKVLRTPAPPSQQGRGHAPRRLGRLLLLLILLALAAAVAYAVMFMPKGGSDSTRSPGPASSPAGSPDPGAGASDGQSPSQSPGAQQPQTSRSAVALAPGYTLRKDSEGFEVGVLKGWQRSPANADRQIRYGSDGFSLLIVPGRDTVKANGNDPLVYQADKELELQPFRDSSWSGSSGLRRIDVGRQAMAEGQFTWQDANGREVYARNLVMIVDGRYHILQVTGPEDRRDKVSDIYEQAIISYRVTS